MKKIISCESTIFEVDKTDLSPRRPALGYDFIDGVVPPESPSNSSFRKERVARLDYRSLHYDLHTPYKKSSTIMAFI